MVYIPSRELIHLQMVDCWIYISENILCWKTFFLSQTLSVWYIYLPWAPKTMKNKGLGHLKTRWFTIKTSKHVGFGGKNGIHAPYKFTIHVGFHTPFPSSVWVSTLPLCPKGDMWVFFAVYLSNEKTLPSWWFSTPLKNISQIGSSPQVGAK